MPSERTIQVALLVVVIAILTVAVLSLARLPVASSAPVLGSIVGLLSAVIGGLVALIARTPGNGSPPKP